MQTLQQFSLYYFGVLLFYSKFSGVEVQLFSNRQICRTNGGPSPNEKCIIPFKWNGKTYNQCPRDSNNRGVYLLQKHFLLILGVFFNYSSGCTFKIGATCMRHNKRFLNDNEVHKKQPFFSRRVDLPLFFLFLLENIK